MNVSIHFNQLINTCVHHVLYEVRVILGFSEVLINIAVL